ncbi:MAG: hypothetical protein WCJ61_06165 [Paludibacter sp.]
MTEIVKLQMILCQMIIHYDGKQSELNYFFEQIQNPNLNFGIIYRTAVLYEKYIFSDFLIQSGKYDINQDPNYVLEIKSCIVSNNSEVVNHYFDDGLEPNATQINEILNFYTTLNCEDYDPELFKRFKYLQKKIKIKKIKELLQNQNQKK